MIASKHARTLVWTVASIFLVILLSACSSLHTKGATDISQGDDPNFKIQTNLDPGFEKYNRKTTVFGISVYAVPGVADSNLLHISNILAQYLDNDEDGEIDNPAVLHNMISSQAFMVVWKKEEDLYRIRPPKEAIGQDVGDDETNPNFVIDGKSERFDAALEEVLHLITHAGYAKTYPEVFGEFEGSLYAAAMDRARGGRFTEIPGQYPESAWYSYYDETCEYDCQVAEYQYWTLTSILGAQENRLEEIQHEWKLNTREKVQNLDPGSYRILTNPEYQLPTVLPDGSYKH